MDIKESIEKFESLSEELKEEMKSFGADCSKGYPIISFPSSKHLTEVSVYACRAYSPSADSYKVYCEMDIKELKDPSNKKALKLRADYMWSMSGKTPKANTSAEMKRMITRMVKEFEEIQ